jgi:hypothetical protein
LGLIFEQGIFFINFEAQNFSLHEKADEKFCSLKCRPLITAPANQLLTQGLSHSQNTSHLHLALIKIEIKCHSIRTTFSHNLFPASSCLCAAAAAAKQIHISRE